ncbi:hypothetical protein SLS58_010122 [Diplodia intermedia]|uniref:Uncharacterized protein n=1 Tax=Diplodia intermedia TaxID=856260 RepID=A0ABR3T803_9PEZI
MPAPSPPASSPPPTPPKQRKRKPDPFRELASTPLPSPLASPGSPESFASQGKDDESALRKAQSQAPSADLRHHQLVLTPFLFASFIISLFLVDRRSRAYRLAEHPAPRGSSWLTYFSPWQWLDPQPYPYQNPTNSTWQDANAGKAQGSDGGISGVNGQADLDRGKRADKQWFIGKKHRKVARLEFMEAFEMRGRIMLALGVAWTLGILALLWSARRLVQVLW